MHGLISPSSYRDTSHFLYEQQTLFRQIWNFAGLLSELVGTLHRGVKIGDTEVLIQCDKFGVPHAYLNVCSHRHTQLCAAGLHKGPVRCPYHGWVYDRNGVPVGIPQPAAFPSVIAQPETFRLAQFRCEVVGDFIFVRLEENGIELADFLGSEYAFLQQVSKSMSGVIDEFRRDVPANWKVLIENSLEGYHVPNVHDQTFMKSEGMKLTEDQRPVDHLDDPRHSSMMHPAAPRWLSRFEHSMQPKIGSWKWRFPYYTHHFIFPNLTITSFMGYSFHIQLFDPVGSALTTVHSRTLAVEFSAQTPMGKKIMEHIYAEGKAFTDRLFDEDAAICARVQAGVEQAQKLAVIGLLIESRILHFHQAYLKA